MEAHVLSNSLRAKKHFFLIESHPCVTIKYLHMYMSLTFITGFIFVNVGASGDSLIYFKEGIWKCKNYQRQGEIKTLSHLAYDLIPLTLEIKYIW